MSERSDHPDFAPAALLLAEIARLKTELMEAKWQIAELEARADVDPLTDILNRRGFDRELTRSLAYVKRYGVPATLVLIDLDGFKAVNDSHGHATGDALLRAVARRLVARVRASDIVARLGGDEFAVLLWNVDQPRVATKARDLEDAIAGASIGEGSISVGASAGTVPLDAQKTPGQVLDAADKAMYARKRERRGGVIVFAHATIDV